MAGLEKIIEVPFLTDITNEALERNDPSVREPIFDQSCRMLNGSSRPFSCAIRREEMGQNSLQKDNRALIAQGGCPAATALHAAVCLEGQRSPTAPKGPPTNNPSAYWD